MIQFKNITIKNFMSIGNATQAVDLNRTDLTLVLGENLDLGSNGSRNGVGKTSLINALSYGLYGDALTNIKKPNLINKTNTKNMLVSVDFVKDNINYHIERGRKPNVLKFFINSEEYNTEDDAQGDSRDTQHTINDVLGLSNSMFKHIVALNTYTEPFLNLRAAEQRNIIEELLGITLLSEKADALRELVKDTKNAIKEEEFKIEAIKEANKRIEEQISGIKRKQQIWDKTQLTNIDKHKKDIANLEKLDIDVEVKAHNELTSYTENSVTLRDANKYVQALNLDDDKQHSMLVQLESEITALKEHKCHTCGQDLHNKKQKELIATKETKQNEIALQLVSNESQREEHLATIAELGELTKPSVFYNTLEEALNHQHSLKSTMQLLESCTAEVNPYTEQIDDMRNKALQEISYDVINESVKLKEHQDFLLKLLTNKDSFIRKTIIEKNLNYLNSRLTYYTNKVGLHQQVKFINDLSVEITDLGRDLDFDNLSRGERNRVILSLSWAFRDVWENLYTPINALFIDEVVDSGMDAMGVDNSLTVLKSMARERNKSVWLISHKDELTSRVNNVLTVTKEDGFTNFNTDTTVNI